MYCAYPKYEGEHTAPTVIAMENILILYMCMCILVIYY